MGPEDKVVRASGPRAFIGLRFDNEGMAYLYKWRSPMTDRDPLLIEREKTHGSFVITAIIAQDLKAVCSHSPCQPIVDARQREVLHMICTKMARILSGNAKAKDHWDDIAGYAKLGSEACE